eukprot:scaffold9607_cov24-Prasinocladus_malaysianus.AAC.2
MSRQVNRRHLRTSLENGFSEKQAKGSAIPIFLGEAMQSSTLQLAPVRFDATQVDLRRCVRIALAMNFIDGYNAWT